MPHLKYMAYLAVVCAVLLDLYSAGPGTSDLWRLMLNAGALLFGVAGLGGLAAGPIRHRRR